MAALGRLASVSSQLDAKPLASPRDHACDCPQERPREPPAQRQVAVVHCVELERRNRTPSTLQQPTRQLNSTAWLGLLEQRRLFSQGRALNCPAPPLAFTRRFHRLPSAIVRVAPAAVQLIVHRQCPTSVCACVRACVRLRVFVHGEVRCARARSCVHARTGVCLYGCMPGVAGNTDDVDMPRSVRCSVYSIDRCSQHARPGY